MKPKVIGYSTNLGKGQITKEEERLGGKMTEQEFCSQCKLDIVDGNKTTKLEATVNSYNNDTGEAIIMFNKPLTFKEAEDICDINKFIFE